MHLCILEEEIDRYAQEAGVDCVGEFVSATKTYPVYVIDYKGETICLTQAPVGSAPAAQFMDWLIGYGVWSKSFPLEPVASQPI